MTMTITKARARAWASARGRGRWTSELSPQASSLLETTGDSDTNQSNEPSRTGISQDEEGCGAGTRTCLKCSVMVTGDCLIETRMERDGDVRVRAASRLECFACSLGWVI